MLRIARCPGGQRSWRCDAAQCRPDVAAQSQRARPLDASTSRQVIWGPRQRWTTRAQSCWGHCHKSCWLLVDATAVHPKGPQKKPRLPVSILPPWRKSVRFLDHLKHAWHPFLMSAPVKSGESKQALPRPAVTIPPPMVGAAALHPWSPAAGPTPTCHETFCF